MDIVAQEESLNAPVWSGCKIPEGCRFNTNFPWSVTTIWPALFPPWYRTTTSPVLPKDQLHVLSFISPVNTGYCCKHNSSIISHLSERRCERTFIGVMWKKLVRSAKGGLSDSQKIPAKSGIAPDVPIHIRSLSPTKLRLRLKAGPKLYYSLSL